MKYKSWLLGLCLSLFGVMLTTIASAQLAWDPKEFMGVDEIAPGMVGYGKTVYQGTKIETFGVEVIGVLKNADFGMDMILVKVTSGPVVDRKLQTVSGMSGSPIYIHDRLIGAYAYGWNFQQEAVAGVTPIANMLECTQPGSVVPPLVGTLVPKNKVLTVGNKIITQVKVVSSQSEAATLQARANPTTMVLSPVATPVFVSGMPDKALGSLQKLFDRYNIKAMPGAGDMDGTGPKLEAGSAVAVSLMEGDADLSAVGTVTYVKGDTVLMFGHPFFGLGKIDLPMSAAYVHGIISSAQSSFKLASPYARQGAVNSDRQYAVAGTTGQEPNMLPVKLFLGDQTRQFTRRYAVEMMNHPDFTPYILYMWVLANGASQMGDFAGDEGTFTARTILSTDSLGDIEQNMIVSPRMAPLPLPMLEFYLLADLLMQNPYGPVKLTGAHIDLKFTPDRNTAIIEKVLPDRLVARPGETVSLDVRVRPYGKPVETRKVAVTVPKYVTDPVMAVVVAGGVHGFMLKTLVDAPPATEEGIKGIVRYLTQIPSSQSLLTIQAFPTPSYAYRGHVLRDMPMSVLDLLRISDAGGMMARGNMGGGNSSEGGEGGEGQEQAAAAQSSARPTTYQFTEDTPFVLSGGQIIMIAVDTEERSIQSLAGKFDLGVNVPVLSTSLSTSQDGKGGPGEAYSEEMRRWFTPQQLARHAHLMEAFATAAAPRLSLPLPRLTFPGLTGVSPLSLSLLADPQADGDIDVQAKPPSSSGDAGASEEPGGDDDEEEADEEEEEADAEETNGPPVKPDQVLLSSKQYSWGLTGRKDFLRGKHIGTGVTSKGRLVLVPTVRTIFQSNELVPWRMVSTANGTYVAGWDSPSVMRLTDDGKGELVFPKQVENAPNAIAVIGLAADGNGNLLVGTWPDQRVRLVSPDGAVTREWMLPGEMIWDLAVTSDGRRYAAGDQGTLYLLRDDEESPLQIGCNVPDKHVLALTAGPNGTLYLATAPRGKVYRLTADRQLESVFETRSAVISLALDGKGNLYVGTSPNCRIYRVSPDGTQREVMRGMGRGNRHVYALKVIGNDLYASTGPAGGIYRISDLTADDPEVTAIFAREDLRSGKEENGNTGPESVMVNALATTPQGHLLAATSSPGQVLKFEPRSEGAFLSAVLQTPVVSRWGNLDVQVTSNEGQAVVVESRSGFTAMPDRTWNTWAAINEKGAEMASEPALFAQFRVRLTGKDNASPALEYARLFFQPVNQSPTVKIDQPTTGTSWSGTKDIRWKGVDPDGDKLVYTVFVSKDDGKTWNQLTKHEAPKANGTSSAQPPAATKDDAAKPKNGKPGPQGKTGEGEKPANAPKTDAPADEAKKPDVHPTAGETDANTLNWDSKSVPDGVYRIKVVASDKYAKPTDAKVAEAITGRIVVDNTAPSAAVNATVYTWDELKRILLTDNLTPIVGGKFRINDGPWNALTAVDGIFNSRQKMVLLVLSNGPMELPTGDHKIIIQAKDAADNVLNRTITLKLGQAPPEPMTKVQVPPVAGGDEKSLAELMLYPLK
ncbi:MAG: SMP-30/gluconolactonase/LRE family protein [Armatimonadota bacterium]